MRRLFGATLVAVTLAAGSVSAASFDFTSLGSGSLGTDTAVLAEGTFVSSGGDLYVGAGGIANSICALSGTCDHDLSLDFNGVASNISFTVGGWQQGDSILVSLFDTGSNLLESTTILANGVFSFTSSGVASMFFDDSSTAAGVSYGDWSFDLDSVAPVPLPAGMPLLLAGLGALGFMRRRRRS